METEDQVVLKTKTKKEYNSEELPHKKFEISQNLIYIFIGIFLFIIFIINIIKLSNKQKASPISNSNLGNSLTIREIEDIQLFDRNKLEKLKKEQIDFCNNPQQSNIKEYEEQITIANISLLSQLFNMYVYKYDDVISTEILNNQNWEGDKTNNLLTALLYYSALLNVNAQDIYVLDIGAKIGWYSLFIAKYGYNIISFEPSEINNYILKKSLCINKELNITLIKKGLNSDEGKCDFYITKGNVGDGWIFCDKNTILPDNLIKSGEVIVTKLDNYIPFLTQNKLGLININIEGLEEKALESGITIMSKYHVPFIYMNFDPRALQAHGTDPKIFLKRFLKFGYKFARYNFFDNDFLSIDEILGRTNDGSHMNLYIVHTKIIKKYNNS